MPVSTIIAIASSFVCTMCSRVSTPARIALIWAWGNHAWHAHVVCMRCASSMTASISSLDMLMTPPACCVSVPPPPEPQILMWSTPARSWVRTILRSSHGPSAVTPGGRCAFAGRSSSRCALVITAQPPARMRGPGTMPCRMASRGLLI